MTLIFLSLRLDTDRASGEKLMGGSEENGPPNI